MAEERFCFMDIQEIEDVINNIARKHTSYENGYSIDDLSDWSNDQSITTFHSKRPV